ncbi:MAG TPA: bifunctional tetrahydrofolate synthase/dihydrofolate synthase [Steroidobacteraceae bacterium]|jgi:dihydrofolate synthase/folylpolyglutamate synthase|nr:bifunctional tetrahydrofolate synthase/dihydrofolate synthase [Steroidobacteraceae bacterium]
MSKTLPEWLALQEAAHPKSIDLGLARVAAVAGRLGIDRPSAAVITVGGTNGKGSTVAHLEAFWLAAGRSVGLFTSPHFLRYNERIRIDGVEAEDAAIIAAFERIEAARGGTTLTFFEYNTLAAILLFEQRQVELALLEVGLGGRLDAANLVDADVSVVCSVGLDHRDWLGDTLEEIGAEKAGIFRAARPAVLGTPRMPSSVYAAIERLGAKPVIAEQDFTWNVEPGAGGAARWSYRGARLSLTDLPPSRLAGSIQYRNAATALAALEALAGGEERSAAAAQVVAVLDPPTVAAGLNRVRLAGRFQIVPGAIEWILDIAHNPPAAEVLACQLQERPCQGRTLAVVGILGDKDAPAIARALAPAVQGWFLCGLEGPRGIGAAELARRLGSIVESPVLADSVPAACEAAQGAARPGDRVIVCGSVHTVGPALQWLGVYSPA